jgi:hypothetical protein
LCIRVVVVHSCCARASLWSCSHTTVILLLFSPFFFFLLHPSMRGHNTYLYLHSISTCARRNFQTVGEAYPFHDRCLFLHLILLPSSCVLLSFLSIQSIVYCGASVNPHRNKFVDRIAFLLRILYGYTVTTVYSVQTFPHKCGRQQLDG